MDYYKVWVVCIAQIIFYLNLFVFSINPSTGKQPNHVILTDGDAYLQKQVNSKVPMIYCYNGKEKHVSSVFETVQVSIDLNDDQYEKYEGGSPAEVLENYRRQQSIWTPNILPFWKRKHIKVDPFNNTCIGIMTKKEHQVTILVNGVDTWQLFKFVLGLTLFLYAQSLSDNQLFYYICGISMGIFGSVIILVYLISRLLPNKPMMYGIAIGGWTIAIYFLQYLLENAKLIVLEHYEYVFGYIGVSGLISFAICYRLGPLSNPRSKKLIQWSLQATGLVLIFYSSYLFEVTYAVDLILLISRVSRFSFLFTGAKFMLVFFCTSLWGYDLKSKLFRPKVKLITKREYAEQGKMETEKALEELRGYCSSPKCKQWKTMLSLKDPVRFAEFVEGSFHLSDDELDAHDSLSIKPNGNIITDDSDSVVDFMDDDKD